MKIEDGLVNDVLSNCYEKNVLIKYCELISTKRSLSSEVESVRWQIEDLHKELIKEIRRFRNDLPQDADKRAFEPMEITLKK